MYYSGAKSVRFLRGGQPLHAQDCGLSDPVSKPTRHHHHPGLLSRARLQGVRYCDSTGLPAPVSPRRAVDGFAAIAVAQLQIHESGEMQLSYRQREIG